jgi:hypothetical protein
MTTMAESAFNEACGYVLDDARQTFADRYANYFSDETDESILPKVRLVRDMLDQGRSWSEATDHPDVYLGFEDRDYVSYVMSCWEMAKEEGDILSLTKYRHQQLVRKAIDEIRRKILIGGDA